MPFGRRTGATAYCALGIYLLAIPKLAAEEAPKWEVLQGEVWPKLTAGADAPECRQALEVATASFRSDAVNFYFVTQDVFERPELEIALAPSGDDSYLFDPALIEEVNINRGVDLLSQSNKELPRVYRYFLQRNAVGGRRFLIAETPFNWAGNHHTVYTVDEYLDRDKQLAVAAWDLSAPPGTTTIIDSQYFEPWLLFDETSQEMTAINPRDGIRYFGNWIVYSGARDGANRAICSIAFRPDTRTVFDVLPDGPLRELAVLLDDLIGTDPGGSMNISGRMRSDVARNWINVLYRPWVTSQPYNTTGEVEAGLLRWSRGAASYAAQYEQYRALYSQALSVLTQHYTSRFGETGGDPTELAERTLDLVVRSHFVFSKSALQPN